MDCRVKNLWCSHHSSPHDPHVYHSYKANFQWCLWDVVSMGIHNFPVASINTIPSPGSLRCPSNALLPSSQSSRGLSPNGTILTCLNHGIISKNCFVSTHVKHIQVNWERHIPKKRCKFSPPTDSWRLIPHSLFGDSWHDNFTICNLSRPFISSNMVVLDSFRDAKEGRLGIPVVGIHHLGVQWWVKTPYFSSTGAFWNQPITDSLGDSSHISLDGPSNPQKKYTWQCVKTLYPWWTSK